MRRPKAIRYPEAMKCSVAIALLLSSSLARAQSAYLQNDTFTGSGQVNATVVFGADA